MNRPEYTPVQDGFNLGETLHLLSGVGNHEAKSLLLLHMNETEAHMNKSQMEHSFRNFVGSSDVWIPTKQSLEQYCTQSLLPVGSVIKGPVETARGISTGYKINDYGRKVGVPIIGQLLAWGLRYPDASVQTIIGPTLSPSNRRAVEARTSIFKSIADSLEGTTTIEEVNTSTAKPEQRDPQTLGRLVDIVDKTAKVLAKAGILVYEPMTDDTSRTFRILDYSPELRGSREKSPTTTAVYDFINSRQQVGESTFTYDECVQSCIEQISSRGEQVDVPKIRAQVAKRLISYPVKGIEATTNNVVVSPKISIAADHTSAVRDFTEILEAISEHDEATIHDGSKQAVSIAKDSDAKRALMTKADRFSSHTKSQPQTVTMQQLLHVIRSSAKPLDGDELSKKYEETFDRPISLEMARQYAKAMTLGKAAVVKSDKRSSPNKTRGIKNMINVYSAVA